MLTPMQLHNLRKSYETISADPERLGDAFFARLFALQPVLRALLPRDQWQRQRDLLAGLDVLVKAMHKPEQIEHVLMDFGAKAQRVGVSPHQYGMARQALVDAMRIVAGEQWTEELEDGWTEVLNTAASVVVLGAGRTRARAA